MKTHVKPLAALLCLLLALMPCVSALGEAAEIGETSAATAEAFVEAIDSSVMEYVAELGGDDGASADGGAEPAEPTEEPESEPSTEDESKSPEPAGEPETEDVSADGSEPESAPEGEPTREAPKGEDETPNAPAEPTDEALTTGETSEQAKAEAEPETLPLSAEPGPVEAMAASSEAQAVVTLGVGEKTALPAPEGADAPAYATSNRKVASVSAKGVVKGVRRGTATVTVTRGGTAQAYTVKVVKAPKRIKFSKKTIRLGFDAASNIGEQLLLSPKLTSGSHSRITYSGYNARVISVSADGVVTAVGTGSTRITARTYNKKKATVRIKVVAAPGSLALDVGALDICAGGTYAFKGVMPKNTASALRFITDSPGVVSVDESGRLTALAEGTANIEASSFNGLKAGCVVRVHPAPRASELSVTTLNLGAKEKSAPLLGIANTCVLGGSVSFSSTKKKVAAVNSQGVVTAKKKGTATIRIRFSDGGSASVKVRVSKAPTRLTLSAKNLTLQVYSGAYLKATMPKNQGGTVTFTSSKPSVAQVDASGLVTGISTGSATITAKTYNGKKAKCTVKVVASVPEIRMSGSIRVTASQYAVFPIEVVASDGGAYKGPVSVTVSPSDVAAYENGRILGKSSGNTATLTVKAGNSKKTCKITVDYNPAAKNVKAIAHRGAKGHWPENTIEAFQNFASVGADGVELDIRSTNDGVQVVFHDATYKAANGIEYILAEQTYETLKALNPSVCTLDEALDVIAATGKEVFMNPKETADGAKCVRAIKARGLQSRTIYFTGTESILKQIYAEDSSSVIGYTLSSGAKATSDAVANKARELHATYVVPHKSLMTQEVVDFWHNKGYRVCVWTVNDRKTTKALCDMGVDAILSDYPEYCVEERAK